MRAVVVLTVLLGLFIGFGVYVQHYLTQTGAQLESVLLAVLDAAQAQKWDEATQKGLHLDERWQQTKDKWGFLTEHDEIDDINDTLSRLRAALYSQDQTATKSEGLAALQLFLHIPEKEAFTLTNIL